MRQRQQRFGADNVTRGGLLHHPARHMRQRPVRLTHNKHLRSGETLPPQDLNVLTVTRVISIKDSSIDVVILGTMPLVRPAPGKHGSVVPWGIVPAAIIARWFIIGCRG